MDNGSDSDEYKCGLVFIVEEGDSSSVVGNYDVEELVIIYFEVTRLLCLGKLTDE